MRTKVMLMMALAAGTLFGQYRDEYGNPGGYRDVDYDEVYDAPPPPRAPSYGHAYRRPPMPGPGCMWVDGYWSFGRGRYFWVNGYWARPPYGGAYWVAPRYNGGRFFAGFWAGPRHRAPAYGYRGNGGYRHDSRHDYGRGYRR